MLTKTYIYKVQMFLFPMRKTLLLIFMGLLLIHLVAAEGEEMFFEPNTTMDIKVFCFDTDSSLCATGVSCKLDTFYPNMSPFRTNLDMQYQSTSNYFNYSIINGTGFVGPYNAVATCNDSITSGYSSFVFYVGKPSTEVQVRMVTISIIVLLVVASLLFYGFLVIKSFPFKWSMFMFSFLFFLMVINIVSIQLMNEASNENVRGIFDTLAGGVYYLYWFTGGILLIIWVLTFMAQLADKQHLRMAEQIGTPTRYDKY